MSEPRDGLLLLVASLAPHDDLAQTHRDTTVAWIRSGAPLWRVTKPDVPPMHLVSYFVLHDPASARYLLVEHRLAGLLLPAGGHVEPGEDPWDTVVRECTEELGYTPPRVRQQPVFLTVTETRRGPGRHTDVSLWYVVSVHETVITWYDIREFTGVRWLTVDQIRSMPLDDLDPHMHRFLDAVGNF